MDCQIERELANKSKQISELQRYFKQEIANLQNIVECNNKLKREVESQRVVIEGHASARNELEVEVKHLT